MRLIRSGEAERVPQSGAVGSVEEAELSLPPGLWQGAWRPEHLERLAGAYWQQVTRATLGLIRVRYTGPSPAVVLVTPRLPLLRFHAPEYETSAEQGSVTLRIERGLLVAPEGRDRGFLRIGVRPEAGSGAGSQARLRVKLEVRNFYPWLRGGGRFARFGAWLYGRTQLRIHVAISNAFLRSLARLDVSRSPTVRP